MTSVSIISAVYNAAEEAESLVNAVNSQTLSSMEFVCADGGSSDGTTQLIERRSRKATTIIAGPDRGIGDAWNKAVEVAQGELLTFQGAGDELSADACELALRTYRGAKNRERTIFVGRCSRATLKGEGGKATRRRYRRALRPISLRFWFPSCFIPSDLVREIGPFNVERRIAVDTDWLARALARGVQFQYADHHVRMEAGGLSDREWRRGYLEYVASLREAGLWMFYDRVVSAAYLACFRRNR